MTIRPILCTIALAGLCACGSADVNLSFRGDDGQRLIAMNETLAVIGTEEDMDEELRGCVETGLRERLDRVTLIPGEQFQSAMSPWFRKGSVPADGAALQEVLAEQQVATRLRSLGLRYIIGLSGASSDESARWGGCGGGYAGFACLGGMGNREAVRLAAMVLDVKAGEV
ncbi:MAG TPA: hypothetical protein VLA52_15305, partial [Thermohalobaculum sp.]|nr:hypothetical protein [Thermohalobaculum sp.]